MSSTTNRVFFLTILLVLAGCPPSQPMVTETATPTTTGTEGETTAGTSDPTTTINPTSETDTIDPTSETDTIDPTSETDTIDPTSETDTIDPTTSETDETDTNECIPWIDGDENCALYHGCYNPAGMNCGFLGDFLCPEDYLCHKPIERAPGGCTKTCSGDTNGLGEALCDVHGTDGKNFTFTCAQICITDDDCSQPPFTEAIVWCSAFGLCLLDCGVGDNEVECPEGQYCDEGTCRNFQWP